MFYINIYPSSNGRKSLKGNYFGFIFRSFISCFHLIREIEQKNNSIFQCLKFPEPIAFAICATAAAIYHDLYDKQHREFIIPDLKRLISHVGLPDHVEDTINAIYNGHGFESLPGFIEVLRKETKDGKLTSQLIDRNDFLVNDTIIGH